MGSHLSLLHGIKQKIYTKKTKNSYVTEEENVMCHITNQKWQKRLQQTS